ncbi:MAG TPA: hypothetical protein VKV15_06515 [Bryobacteraceae bacterium]|nr:hypothetical protein [Bryobacteraceae bacterium]
MSEREVGHPPPPRKALDENGLSLISSTRHSFSKMTQRQFSGDPIGPNLLSLSPPY